MRADGRWEPFALGQRTGSSRLLQPPRQSSPIFRPAYTQSPWSPVKTISPPDRRGWACRCWMPTACLPPRATWPRRFLMVFSMSERSRTASPIELQTAADALTDDHPQLRGGMNRLKRPEYLPTRRQIVEQCAEIRRNWTNSERRRRSVGHGMASVDDTWCRRRSSRRSAWPASGRSSPTPFRIFQSRR